MRHPLILGHRGSPLEQPENTLAGFVRALEQGADGVECDLRQLRDGTVVLFHDGTAGGRVVEDLDRGELEALVGVVEEASVLEQLPADAVIDLEIKKSGWEEHLLELASRIRGAFITSFDHGVIQRVAELGWSGATGALIEEPAHLDRSHPGVLAARYILPRSPRVSGEEIRGWVESGFEVLPWTVNDPGRARQLIGWGCAGIITDLPGLMAAELRSGTD